MIRDGLMAVLLLLLASGLGAVLLLTDSEHGRVVEPYGTDRLPPFKIDPESIDEIRIEGERTSLAHLVRMGRGEWQLTEPLQARAEGGKVDAFLNKLLFARPKDILTAQDLTRLGRTMADFGLATPAMRVMLRSGMRTVTLLPGSSVPGLAERYAALEGDGRIFVFDGAILQPLETAADYFRQTALFPFAAEEVRSIDLQMPDAAFLRMVRSTHGEWKITEPKVSGVNADLAEDLVATLLAARVQMATADGEAAVVSGLTVRMTTQSGRNEIVTFSTNVLDGVVTCRRLNEDGNLKIDAKVCDVCLRALHGLRDKHLFGVAMRDVRRVDLQSAGMSVALVRLPDEGGWRLMAPVTAPADDARVEELLGRLMALEESAIADHSGAGIAVRLEMEGDEAFEKHVKPSALETEHLAVDLRSKVMLRIVADLVTRLAVKRDGRRASFVRDRGRATWMPEEKGFALSSSHVARMVAALSELRAVGVEQLAATQSSRAQYGLEHPHTVITIDAASGEALRHNLLIGDAAPAGGRYAMIGGDDTIFILGRAASDLFLLSEEASLGASTDNINKGKDK